MQVVEQTDEEKLTMYMKLSKKELSKMLIEANKHLQRMELRPIYIDRDQGFQEIKPQYPQWPTSPHFNPSTPLPDFNIICSTGNT